MSPTENRLWLLITFLVLLAGLGALVTIIVEGGNRTRPDDPPRLSVVRVEFPDATCFCPRRVFVDECEHDVAISCIPKEVTP
jgi:hypothetical protein